MSTPDEHENEFEDNSESDENQANDEQQEESPPSTSNAVSTPITRKNKLPRRENCKTEGCANNKKATPEKFYKRKDGSYHPYCKNCVSNRGKEEKYGISEKEYDEWFQKQEGKCAICGLSGVKLVVDHCHERAIAYVPYDKRQSKDFDTWKRDPSKAADVLKGLKDNTDRQACIRGLLCSKCNSGLGLLGDNVNNLLKATGYLHENRSRHFRDHIKGQATENAKPPVTTTLTLEKSPSTSAIAPCKASTQSTPVTPVTVPPVPHAGPLSAPAASTSSEKQKPRGKIMNAGLPAKAKVAPPTTPTKCAPLDPNQGPVVADPHRSSGGSSL